MTDAVLITEPGCMDDSDPHSLPYEIALKKIIASITPVSGTEVVLIHQALGRVLAADLIATMNVPPAANSAMDGYAVHSSDIPTTGTHELTLAGKSLAGKPYTGSVPRGSCVRILTGAVLPDGTDTVIMQENVVVTADRVMLDARTVKGDNVRPIGEDCKRGDVLLRAGSLLTPAALGVIASMGIAEITVTRKLKIAVFMTGDELRSPGESLAPGQIYDSNRYTLHGMLTRPGVGIIDLGIIRDDRQAIEQALITAANSADAIITSGGVSVGDADLVREVVEKLGRINFWKVAMKPGRPLAFGSINNAWFFGLPGNPVSTMATFYLFVQPALQRLSGQTPTIPVTMKVPCTSILKKRPGRLEYQRGILSHYPNGEWTVTKTGAQGSGILSSMTQANCFIVLPVENDGVMAGETVEVMPFYGLV
jgi:molybdopterin molybdotransferase